MAGLMDWGYMVNSDDGLFGFGVFSRDDFLGGFYWYVLYALVFEVGMIIDKTESKCVVYIYVPDAGGTMTWSSMTAYLHPSRLQL